MCRSANDPPTATTPRERVEAVLLALAAARAPGGTACPSEAARQLDPDGWRALMPAVRAAALDLARAGRLQLRQRGQPVAPHRLRGPFRIALPDHAPAP